ncbi:MAG: hypothetical protein AAB358_03010 [Patescibacteria group bacterium]
MFGEGNYPLAEAYRLIGQSHSPGGGYEKLFEFIGEKAGKGQFFSYASTAKIIAAVVVDNHQIYTNFRGHDVAKTLVHFFGRNGEWRDSLPLGSSYDFLCGIPLGVFQGVAWLDRCSIANEFEKVIVDRNILVDLITWNGTIPDIEILTWSPKKEYEAELSKAVKACFRPPSKTGKINQRLAAAQAIMERVVEHKGTLGELSALGEMVLKKICFVVAGSMNPVAFSDAISSHFRRELFSVSAPKKEEEIAKLE